MKYKLSTIVLPGSKAITFYFKNKKRDVTKTLTFSDTHPNFQLALAWLNNTRQSELFLEKRKVYEEDAENLFGLYDIYSAVTKWSNGELEINRQGATYKGKAIDSDLEAMLLKVFLADPTAEDTFEAWTQYLDIATGYDVSYKVAKRLFLFLKKNDLSITKEGKVLAWKVVRSNYKDKHSNTFDNSVGQVVEMPRSQVNDDDNQHCSYGLHVCSWGYLSSFSSYGDPVMQVEVDIKDIVSIPLDYDGEKVRVCKYKVVAEAGKWGQDVDSTRLPVKLISNSFAANA